MPPVAFTYEMDGETSFPIFGEQVTIPGPDNPADPCPFCGPSLPDNITRIMRKGYYGAVSYVDHCVGTLLDELERLGHADDTVIAIVGDHGWQLGEHNIWGKHSLSRYSRLAHSPFMQASTPILSSAPGCP